VTVKGMREIVVRSAGCRGCACERPRKMSLYGSDDRSQIKRIVYLPAAVGDNSERLGSEQLRRALQSHALGGTQAGSSGPMPLAGDSPGIGHSRS